MHLPTEEPTGNPYDSLLNAAAVRERCQRIGELARSGATFWFNLDERRIPGCVKLVRETCLLNYPDLVIPLHSRWRHFDIAGTDLWHHYTRGFQGDPVALARSAVDLVFVSVLLDAGAGADWRYTDPVTGSLLSRSEGLAAASVDLFFNHLSTFDPEQGWVVSGENLLTLDTIQLGGVLQHSKDNPLTGVEGRLELLHGLGRLLDQSRMPVPGLGRAGFLVDVFQQLATDNGSSEIDISDVLVLVLRCFGDMWPSGLVRDGINLGDCGFHSALETEDETNGIVPFHKLSQWLTYSLVEPLRISGLRVTNLDALTGLPEYRNGGLLIDTRVLQPRNPDLFGESLAVTSEAVVEWRALTVYLLDHITEMLRTELELDAEQLPLCSVLQGGTWAAGRATAAQLRSDGGPPLNLAIDGTVF